MGKINRDRPCTGPGCRGHAEPWSKLCLQCELLGREPPSRRVLRQIAAGVSPEVALGQLAGKE